MKFPAFILLLLFINACTFKRQRHDNDESLAQQQVPDSVQSMLVTGQMQFIAAMTGYSNINDSEKINRRWSDDEKLIVRNFISNRLRETGIYALEQPYTINLPRSNKMRTHNPFTGTNLYARLPATQASNEYIVLGAHYDTVKESPGASDNATGCALVYGVARLLSQIKNRSKHVFIVFFDQEEGGHAGAQRFTDFLKENAFNVHSVHTADQVGWDKDGDRNIELEKPTAYLKSVYKKHAKAFGINIYTTKVTASDHKEFRNGGFRATGITEEYKHGDTSPHHHEPTDTYDTVNFEYLAFVTYIVYKVIEELIS